VANQGFISSIEAGFHSDMNYLLFRRLEESDGETANDGLPLTKDVPETIRVSILCQEKKGASRPKLLTYHYSVNGFIDLVVFLNGRMRCLLASQPD
jgi:hypothetical protein